MEILHNEAGKKFYCEIDGKECAINYEPVKDDPSTINLYRTFVHPDLRGKGIAEELMKAITEYAVKNNLKILPTCSYAVLYYKRRKELKDVVSEKTDPESGGACRLPG
jgi:predicted GNAT family acetyltransferase